MSVQASSKRASRGARATVFLSLALFGAAGCASIIGLDDYTVKGNSGGAAGAGGGGGAIHHAGAPSAGAAGEVTPEGGAAGTTDVPPIVGCDGQTEFTPNEQVVRSCLLRAGCNPSFNPVRTISTCVSKNTQKTLAGESCNLDAQTCKDYEDCEHEGVAHDDLCGGTKKTRCQGDLAVNCGNYKGDDRFTDCAALGGHCGTYTYADNNLLYADCTLDVSPQTCVGMPDSDVSEFCHKEQDQPDLRYYCYGEQAYGSSCSAFATCVDDSVSSDGGAPAVGKATCYFNTQDCTGPDVPTCSNGTATVCSSGALFKYSCGSVGLSCGIQNADDYCLAPGCKAADVDTCAESCSDDGTQLTFCYGGAPYTVTCSDYGFTQCLSDKFDDGTPYAACRY